MTEFGRPEDVLLASPHLHRQAISILDATSLLTCDGLQTT